MKKIINLILLINLAILFSCNFQWEKIPKEEKIPIYHDFSDDVQPCTLYTYTNKDIETFTTGWSLDDKGFNPIATREDTAIFEYHENFSDTCIVRFNQSNNSVHYTGSTEIVWPPIPSTVEIKGLKLIDTNQWDSLYGDFQLHIKLVSLYATNQSAKIDFNINDFDKDNRLLLDTPISFSIFTTDRESVYGNDECFYITLYNGTEKIYSTSNINADELFMEVEVGRNKIATKKSPHLQLLIDWLP